MHEIDVFPTKLLSFDFFLQARTSELPSFQVQAELKEKNRAAHEELQTLKAERGVSS